MNSVARKFKIGIREIAFPLPSNSLKENIEALMPEFSIFRFTKVLEEDAQIQSDGSLCYVVVMPPVKTNG